LIAIIAQPLQNNPNTLPVAERLKSSELGGLLNGATGELAAKEQELQHERSAKVRGLAATRT
jgi:hypothetical protein